MNPNENPPMPDGTDGSTSLPRPYSKPAISPVKRPTTGPLLAAALKYADDGLSVFPLVPGSKKPATAHGFKEASTDPIVIRRWWRKNPHANIGIACGASGLFVVDEDTYGKKRGAESLARLVSDLGSDPFPCTLRAITRSGGIHYAFRIPPDTLTKCAENAAGYINIDVRAEGGYIVAAPSYVLKDIKGPSGAYRWDGPFKLSRIQTAPSGLVSLLMAKPVKATAKSVSKATEHTGSASANRNDLQERIVREALLGAFDGNRNARTLHLACQMRDNDFTQAETTDLAERFAAACPGKGFDADEAADAIASAYTRPPREPWATAPTGATAPTETTATPEAAPARTRTPWPELADEALYGPVGDFVRAVLPICESDAPALLVQMLVAIGNAMGRGPHFNTGAVRHGGNEFAALVGATGCGKGMSWGYVADELKSVDPEWFATRQFTSFPSGESIPWAVRDPQVKRKNVAPKGKPAQYEEVMEDGVDDKRLFIRYSELREVFDFMSRSGNTLSATLRSAFDGDLLQNSGKTNPCTVHEHLISFLGQITPRELLRTVPRGELSNGLVNRFVWVLTRSERDIPDPVRLDAKTRNKLAIAFRRAHAWAAKEREYRRDADADAVWRALYPYLKRRPDSLMGAITERARVHVMRLALIYAVLDCDTAIRVTHLLAALALWQFCETSAMRIFEPIAGELDPAAKIYRYLVSKGTADATRTEIRLDCFGNNMDSGSVSAALEHLESMNAATRICGNATPKGGRPAERWHANVLESGGYRVFKYDSVGLVDYLETAKRVVASLPETNSGNPAPADESDNAPPAGLLINSKTALESCQADDESSDDDGWEEVVL